MILIIIINVIAITAFVNDFFCVTHWKLIDQKMENVKKNILPLQYVETPCTLQ